MTTDRPVVDRPQRRAYRTPKAFAVKVVGVSFRSEYPRNLHLLADLVADTERAAASDEARGLFRPERARILDRTLVEGAVPIALRREPDNPKDPLAVSVWVPLIEAGALGYLPASKFGSIGHRVAESIDAGDAWAGWIEKVWINWDFPERPGITIKLRKVSA